MNKVDALLPRSRRVARSPVTTALDRLRSFLIDEWDLGGDLTESYLLSLERGHLTARMVCDANSGLSPSQANGILNRLCKGRYLRRSPERGMPGNPGGRGRGKVYRPVPPDQVLLPVLNSATQLWPYLGQIAEHLENLPDIKPEETSDVWILEHSQILPTFEAEVAAAKSSIVARGNDLEWLGQGSVLEFLRKARKRGVRVSLAGTEPSSSTKRLAQGSGLRITKAVDLSAPLAVFDTKTIMVAYRVSQTGTSYRCLLIHN